MPIDNEAIVEKWVAAWNSHDVDDIASFYTDDGIHEDVAVGSVFHGKDEIKKGISPLFSACPDFKMELKSIFGNDDRVATEWVQTGTQTEAFGDLKIPATGKSFSVHGASITTLSRGKIARNSDYWNLLTMLQQIGLLPEKP